MLASNSGEPGSSAGPLDMPLAIGRHIAPVVGPGIERVVAQRVGQLARIERNVAGAGRNRAGFDAVATQQQLGIVAADAVDDLRDLEQAQRQRTAGVIQTRQIGWPAPFRTASSSNRCRKACGFRRSTTSPAFLF